MHNGPGDQLREKAHEQRVVKKIVLPCKPTVGIDKIGDLLKGEKRDRKRQHNGFQDKTGIGKGIEGIHEEVGILEISKQHKVDSDAEYHKHPGASLREPRPDKIIERHGEQDQEKVDRIPPPIKEQRGRGQPGYRDAAALTGVQQVKDNQGHRKKGQNKDVGIKQHI